MDLFAPEDRDRAMKAIDTATSEGHAERRVRLGVLKSNGRRISLDIVIAPSEVTGGRRLLFLARPAEQPASTAMPSSPLDIDEVDTGAGGAVRPSPRANSKSWI